jgi:hypothetical protein
VFTTYLLFYIIKNFLSFSLASFFKMLIGLLLIVCFKGNIISASTSIITKKKFSLTVILSFISLFSARLSIVLSTRSPLIFVLKLVCLTLVLKFAAALVSVNKSFFLLF